MLNLLNTVMVQKYFFFYCFSHFHIDWLLLVCFGCRQYSMETETISRQWFVFQRSLDRFWDLRLQLIDEIFNSRIKNLSWYQALQFDSIHHTLYVILLNYVASINKSVKIKITLFILIIFRTLFSLYGRTFISHRTFDTLKY